MLTKLTDINSLQVDPAAQARLQIPLCLEIQVLFGVQYLVSSKTGNVGSDLTRLIEAGLKFNIL